MKPRHAMSHWLAPALLAAALASASADAQLLPEPPRGEAVERHLPGEIKPTQWARDPNQFGTLAGDRLETREVAAEQLDDGQADQPRAADSFRGGRRGDPR